MSSVAAGPFAAVAALLLIAGVAKVSRPQATAAALTAAGLGLRSRALAVLGRMLGLFEVALAIAAVAWGNRALALGVMAVYLAFAAFTLRIIAHSAGKADCGCFGAPGSPATNQHVALNIGAAAIAGIAVVMPPGPIADVMADQPLAGVPFVALVAICTWLGHVAYTLLPDLIAAQRTDPPGREGGR